MTFSTIRSEIYSPDDSESDDLLPASTKQIRIIAIILILIDLILGILSLLSIDSTL